jgi:hypothetical protein
MEQMNITLAQYIDDPETAGNRDNIKAVINDTTVFVPLDPANRHYAEIMRQVEAGELVIQEADSGSE